jgi:Ras family protein T1
MIQPVNNTNNTTRLTWSRSQRVPRSFRRYPTTQLYDSSVAALKPVTVDAFTRIFTICDFDKDGLLDNDEIAAFQRKVFGQDVSDEQCEQIKVVVEKADPEGVDGGP